MVESSDIPKTPFVNEENGTIKHTNTTDSLQKTWKEPDSILPCPCCNSMETKYCYYNNQNVSQPRKFCKSHLKNKKSDSRIRHINVSEAVRAVQINTAKGLHDALLKDRETVISFGAQSSLCLPVFSVECYQEKGSGQYIK